MLDFVEILDTYVASDEKVWEFDRSLTLGASEAFGCLRQSWYKKNGVKPDKDYEETWGAMRRGDIIENEFLAPAITQVLENDEDSEHQLICAGTNQKTLVSGLLSATPDGLLVDLEKDALVKYGIKDIKSDCVVAEFKSIDPRVNLAEAKAIHKGQVQVQMGILRETTNYQPMYAVILYVNASFLDDIKVFIVEFSEKAYRNAKLRAEKVFGSKKAIDLLPEGRFDDGCKYCSFQKQCMQLSIDAIPAEDTEEYSSEAVELMGKLVSKRRKVKGKLDKLNVKEKTLNEQMRELLRLEDTKKINPEEETWSVSNSFVKGRASLDKKAMIADGIDLEQYTTIGSAYEKLTVTEK